MGGASPAVDRQMFHVKRGAARPPASHSQAGAELTRGGVRDRGARGCPRARASGSAGRRAGWEDGGRQVSSSVSAGAREILRAGGALGSGNARDGGTALECGNVRDAGRAPGGSGSTPEGSGEWSTLRRRPQPSELRGDREDPGSAAQRAPPDGDRGPGRRTQAHAEFILYQDTDPGQDTDPDVPLQADAGEGGTPAVPAPDTQGRTPAPHRGTRRDRGSAPGQRRSLGPGERATHLAPRRPGLRPPGQPSRGTRE